MEPEEYTKYWEDTLSAWDGSTKNTYGGNQAGFIEHNSHIPHFVVDDQSQNDSIDFAALFGEDDIEKSEELEDTKPLESKNIAVEDSKGSISYKILQRIASGGAGVVYKAHQESLGREVAIKKLLDNTDPAEKSNFIAESKITAYLSHPNIVPIHEIGINDEQELMLTMKFVAGNSWKASLRKHNQDDLDKNLQIFLSVMNAIAFAHSKGIVHNDLKPDNVMVGEFGEVLVMDWGIALDISEDIPEEPRFTHRSMITSPLGTPCYMAPEQATGNGSLIGPWTDVYLLGGILYEILTGAAPHNGSYQEILEAITSENHQLEWPEEVPEELQKICEKAMSTDTIERYQNVLEFQKDIENFLQHRESLKITDNSHKILQDCRRKMNSFLAMSKQDRDNLYDDFALAISGFYQAIELWADNEKAKVYQEKARLEYAKIAIQNLDLGLAQTQLRKLDAQNKDVIALQEKIDNAQELRQCKAISEKLIVIASFTCCAIVFRFALSLLLPKQDKLYFMQNNFASVTVCLLIFFSSLAWVHILRRANFSKLKNLLNVAILYEVIGVFLIAFMFTSVHFDGDAVPTGVFPPAAIILLFRVIVPYPVKLSIIAGGLSATTAALTLLVGKPLLGMPYPPELIIIPYIVECFMMAGIGVLLAKFLRSDGGA